MEPWLFTIISLWYLLVVGFTCRYVPLSRAPQVLVFVLWLVTVVGGILFSIISFSETERCHHTRGSCLLNHEVLAPIPRACVEIATSSLLYLRALAANPPPHGSAAIRVLATLAYLFFLTVNSVPNLLLTVVASGAGTVDEVGRPNRPIGRSVGRSARPSDRGWGLLRCRPVHVEPAFSAPQYFSLPS